MHPRSRIGADLAAGPRFGLREGATVVRVDLCHLASRSALHRKFFPRQWSLVHFHFRPLHRVGVSARWLRWRHHHRARASQRPLLPSLSRVHQTRALHIVSQPHLHRNHTCTHCGQAHTHANASQIAAAHRGNTTQHCRRDFRRHPADAEEHHRSGS